MSDTVWLFLGLALAISFAGDRITYAIKGTPPGGLKPWAETIGRVLGGVIGSVPGVVLGNPYITGVGGLLGIEIGPAIFSFVFPAPKGNPAGRLKGPPTLMNFTGEELLSLLTSAEEATTKLGETYIYGVYDGLAAAAVVAKADLLFAMPEFVRGREVLNRKLKAIGCPKVIVFNGKIVYEQFMGRKCKYGLQDNTLCGAKVYVVPSTSRRCGRISYRQELRHFRSVFQLLQNS
jgi:hypothetical protein